MIYIMPLQSVGEASVSENFDPSTSHYKTLSPHTALPIDHATELNVIH